MVKVGLQLGPNEQEDIGGQGTQVQVQNYSEKNPHVVEVQEQEEAELGVIPPASVEAQEQEQAELGVIHSASVKGSVVIWGYQVFVCSIKACFEGFDP